jgi:hypothetical protein
MYFTAQIIEKLQRSWADGIIAIGQASLNGNDYKQLAQQFVQDHYLFTQDKPLLFKPTRASEIPFRSTLAGATSYFVGGDSSFPEDNGFALEPWLDIKFHNYEILLEDEFAIAMGEYYLTSKQDKCIKVEYTFGYKLDDNNEAKIFLHHSSFPFSR